MDKQLKVAVYIRLSVADEDTGRGRKESESVGNQRILIHSFLDNHKELSEHPRIELIDDGFTGTNLCRPGFQEMIERVRAGEIGVICVKDFSRFSRDYIETGNYLECVFPFLGVRFISINDGYDSNDYKGTTGGLEVVMRSIIYASYSKDLSIKTTTAKLHMMKQGKYVGGFAPYGYTLHPEVRNKLAVDPEAAAIVRRIFMEAIEGSRTGEIAEHLNDDAVPTPGQYFRSKHPDKSKFNRMSSKASWTAQMVYGILTRYVYTGAAVAHKRKSAGIGTKKTIAQSPGDWIVVEEMHEAIVSREEFEQAQAVIRKAGKCAARKGRDYPLKGLVRCGNCGRVMQRNGKNYSCPYSLQDKDTDCAVKERYNESELENTVFQAIGRYVSQVEVSDRMIKASMPMEQMRARLKSLRLQEAQISSGKLYCYNLYAEGAISRDEYLKKRADYVQQLAEIETEIQNEEKQIHALEAERTPPDLDAGPLSRLFDGAERLTAEISHAFLKAVYIHPSNRVELEWKVKGFPDA